MKESPKTKPNLITYNTLLDACGRCIFILNYIIAKIIFF